jgi:uncharacterized membrane protein YhaH (DUF805 family)
MAFANIMNKCFSFQGRVGRLAYLGYGLLSGAVCGLVMGMCFFTAYSAHHSGNTGLRIPFIVIGGVAIIILLWSLLALEVKRLHDMNISGFWILGLFLIGSVLGAIKHLVPGIQYVEIALNITTFIVFYFVPGTAGPNRFE